MGDAFRLRCRDIETDQEPLAFTQSLAVDLSALTMIQDDGC
jgi:hypothetical protein